ncbi:restriction endonuclease [Acetobacter sacchari]|uniref:Restriction endonuclease n=1 Tax=Acetobacter sacchari TaxID=2661687 RepID=A0ABS3LYH3_9PROT|nr:restriction endonuclease [Acetobacter sacchari]MBO1360971.1 restriction endonuclease [Acetobacter sacchari]
MTNISFSNLENAPLIVDATYESDRNNTKVISSEPLSRLTKTGNQGGFRFSGTKASPKLVVLYTTLNEIDWPDFIDYENGLLYYYGDNRKPGSELHTGGRGGNEILRTIFALSHGTAADRAQVPPLLVFSKGNKHRDVIFRGLAVPGASHLDSTSDLVAIWKSIGGKRFQNYKAVFTILDISRINRKWLNAINNGDTLGEDCPKPFRAWVKKHHFAPLKAPPVTRIRTQQEQAGTDFQQRIGQAIYEHFKDDPIKFEEFSAFIVEKMDSNVTSLELTRPSKDGGRDGIGQYRIGKTQNCIHVDFALEAKCYEPSSGLGVKILSRLISRLRHRQFGVLVTTSFLGSQAYQELVEDRHPIVICSGGDVADILTKTVRLRGARDTSAWLREHFPIKK